MEIGLIHGHKGLAYLMFVLALVNVVLSLMPNKNTPKMAKVMKISHMLLMNTGRLTLLVGLSVWGLVHSSTPVMSMWWAWSALLLWGPMEVVAKRLVKPEVGYITDGGQASQKLTVGVVLELVIVAIIFGLMSVKGLR